ncbi:MAG: AbrB/MazE/SpoVT family DNA-binding domain-containing protein [Dermatophilaceae bacterium]
MQTTIDSAGRIVVPKALRDAMRLRPGQTVDIVFADGRLQIDVAATSIRLEETESLPVAVPDAPVSPLDATVVRDTLESTRR